MFRRSLIAFIAFPLVVMAMALGPTPALALTSGTGAISLTAVGTSYVQGFDSLTNSPNAVTSNALPAGWFIDESGTSARNDGKYTVGTGSDTSGDTYGFGAAAATDRALGALRSGTLVPLFGAAFMNSTGAQITKLAISYTGEQWRLGAVRTGTGDRIDLQYSLDATSLTSGAWTDANALDFSSPITTGTAGALNGNLASNRTAITADLIVAIPDGATVWIRWVDFDVPSSDDGLAVDDFSLTPIVTDQAPFITATSPLADAASVALDSNITVTFSEPVDVSAGWSSIDCAVSHGHTAPTTGGPTAFTLDPDVNFAPNEACMVTVFAAKVADQDANDPPDTMAADYAFTFQTADVLVCGDPATRIHDVQGSGSTSPIVNSLVTIEGVVVGDYQAPAVEFGGFYVEEEAADADADPATSEGVFVFDNGFGVVVSPGEVVRVRGRVTEFSGLTEIASLNAVLVCASGASVPATPVSLPVANVNDLERFEGMLVNFDQTLTATEVFNLGRFGEVSLSGAGRLYTPTAVTTPGAAANALALENNRSRIILDDGNNQQNIDPTRYPQGGLTASNTLRVGDTLPGLTGVMDFRFGFYRIQPVGPLSFDHSNPRTAAPDAVGGNLEIATFNVLNFFNGDGLGGGFPTARGANTLAEFARQRAKEISAIGALNADVVGLSEIENDAPPNSAIEDLVAGLNEAMGAGTYAFIDTGVIGTDAIKVAFIYKPAAVTPVGAYKLITSAVDPRFIDTLNRPSLAQTFQHNASGQKLTIVVNHLKSKSSDCNAVGDPDAGDGQGNCNITRRNAAAALVDWLRTDPTGSGDPDFLVIGDLNSYAFEDPITTLTNGGLTNLVESFEGPDAYSYVFNGESGYLDHALASSSLVAQVTGETHWHINPDEPNVLDYNTEFKTANQVNTFYSTGPYRASDHDPVLLGLHMNMPPTVGAGGPYAVAEGGSVMLTASGSDPDGDTLTYAWDLDNNGTFETPGQSVTFSAASIDGPAARATSVRATDSGGLSAAASTTINVTNVAPTANAGGPYSGAPGEQISFSGSASDPAPADTLTYLWDFDYSGTFAADASGADLTSAKHAYPAKGTYTVALRVTDDDGGASAVSTATVNVTDRAPSASAGGPYTVSEGGSVQLTASGSDADGDPLTYSWDLDNNGTFETPGQSVTFSAAALDGPSTWTVKVRAFDGELATVAAALVTVQNVAPTASAGGPYAGVPFGSVTFLGSANDPAGPRDTLSFAWDFDYRGTFATDAIGVDLKSPTHAYAAPGTYTVGLRVSDDDGGSSFAFASVTIAVPESTEGRIEGNPTWERGIRTKIKVEMKRRETNSDNIENHGESSVENRREKKSDIKGQVQFEGDRHDYESTRLDSMVISGFDATVYGAFGSVTFRLDVHDGGREGSDTLRLRTSDGYDSGVLMHPRGKLTITLK